MEVADRIDRKDVFRERALDYLWRRVAEDEMHASLQSAVRLCAP